MIWSQVLITILGSGFIAAIVAGYLNYYQQTRQLKIELLEKQLLLLYGPVHFYCVQNQALMKQFMLVINPEIEFLSKSNRANEPKSEEEISRINDLVAMLHSYTGQFLENTNAVIKVMGENWCHVDTDDISLFLDFLSSLNVARTKYEAKMKVGFNPKTLTEFLGDSYFDLPVIVRVQKAFEEKKNTVKELRFGI